MPTLNSILLAAYGTERKGFLTIDKEGFKEAQFQNLVIALIEGKSIPSNIKKTLAQNIRNRQRYNKTWNLVLMVSLAVLDEGRDGGRKEYKKMREKSDQTRSYLYGRLLAIYEESEKAVLRHKERRTEAKSSDELSGKSNIRRNTFSAYGKTIQLCCLRVLELKWISSQPCSALRRICCYAFLAIEQEDICSFDC